MQLDNEAVSRLVEQGAFVVLFVVFALSMLRIFMSYIKSRDAEFVKTMQSIHKSMKELSETVIAQTSTISAIMHQHGELSGKITLLVGEVTDIRKDINSILKDFENG